MNTAAQTTNKTVLLIEDNPGDILLINKYFLEWDSSEFKIENCHSLAEGIRKVKSSKIAAVILDLGLPDSSGIESVKRLNEADSSLPIIVLTIVKSDQMGLEAIEAGAQDFLAKDELQFSNLLKTIQYAINRKKLEIKLRTSLEMLDNTFEHSAVGMLHINPDKLIVKSNLQFSQITGYSKNELKSLPMTGFIHKEDWLTWNENVEQVRTGSVRGLKFNIRFIGKDDSIIWTAVTVTGVFLDDENCEYIFATVEDISSRVILEEKLNQQRKIVEKIVNSLPVGVWLADAEGNIIRCNQKGEEIWRGSKYVSIDNLHEYKAWWADTGEQLKNEDWAIYRVIKNKESYLNEILKIECFDGSEKIIINSAVALMEDDKLTGVVVVNEDVTKLIKTEQELMSLVEQKEFLLKESHHRIKNNLQLMSSMLNLSLENLKDSASASVIKENINRLITISKLHEYLYKTDGLNSVNTISYLGNIIRLIEQSVFGGDMKVKLTPELDNFDISSRLAISLGLIVNELIMNSYKYAFTNSSGGEIRIVLKKNNGEIELLFKDNGKGLPFRDLNEIESLGYQIISSLVSQHNGIINIKNEGGTVINILFPSAV